MNREELLNLVAELSKDPLACPSGKWYLVLSDDTISLVCSKPSPSTGTVLAILDHADLRHGLTPQLVTRIMKNYRKCKEFKKPCPPTLQLFQ